MHSSLAHPLNLASSYNSSCSSDSISLSVSLGFVSKKMPHLFCSDGLPAVMQEFPRLVCLLESPLSLSLFPFVMSLYPSKLLLVKCLNQQFSHIYPLLSVCHPSVYSQFFVFCLPVAWSGRQNGKFRSGRQATINFEWKEYVCEMACLWWLFDIFRSCDMHTFSIPRQFYSCNTSSDSSCYFHKAQRMIHV